MITVRDIDIIRAVALYYVLSREQIQRLFFDEGKSGARVSRRRLQYLLSLNLINRHTLFAMNPILGTPAPVYYPARKGLELLAEHFDDESFLLTPTHPPSPNNILHWLAITDTHMVASQALERQEEVNLDGWLNEWDVANKEESRSEKRFRIYQLLEQFPKRLVCAPDAVFLLSARGFKKVFFLEQDRCTAGIKQIAASKPKGYSVLAERHLHKKIFPETNVDSFTVIAVTPTESRRDALRKAFADVPGKHLWKFVSKTDLRPETFFQASVYFPVDGDPVPLIKPNQPVKQNPSVVVGEPK